MNKIDHFDRALEKEFKKLENWMNRLRKRMFFLEQVYLRTRQNRPDHIPSKKVQQLNFFQ